jgi:hypothetical protein
MEIITSIGLKKHDKENISVLRRDEKNEYKLKGVLSYQVLWNGELFFVEAGDDGCILQNGDEVTLGGRKYQVDFRFL